MTSKDFGELEAAGFSGTAPLFPLPNAVLFPQIVQPLHIFEDRYRAMTADALNGERVLAMALLQSGWEASAEQNDIPIHPVVCLGRITLDQQLEDGRYMLLVRGISRARVVSEDTTSRPYRIGQLELLEDRYPQDPMIDRKARRDELLDLFYELYPGDASHQTVQPFLERELGLGALCDLLAYVSHLPAERAAAVLAELNVDARSDLVLDEMRTRLRSQTARERSEPFPPDFSVN
ncbi:Lon protease 2 [Maioricimonas rarisocia]|uniref:Lon protease 2 n=1 Tax=Maioricimonas rarisocia TaxID=2528026 RepID=A0A517ZA00_9PLAN|nr:LON peptidase substrate-binding domain-containing protein [Maioricimonas rarisocia]QDU39271.1 Lon protease 2 [Maioricimonas rarisocia]